MTLKEKAKEFVHNSGADFVGVTPRFRFEKAPAFSNPRTLLPDIRSVVVFGLAMKYDQQTSFIMDGPGHVHQKLDGGGAMALSFFQKAN